MERHVADNNLPSRKRKYKQLNERIYRFVQQYDVGAKTQYLGGIT